MLATNLIGATVLSKTSGEDGDIVALYPTGHGLVAYFMDMAGEIHEELLTDLIINMDGDDEDDEEDEEEEEEEE